MGGGVLLLVSSEALESRRRDEGCRGKAGRTPGDRLKRNQTVSKVCGSQDSTEEMPLVA